MKTAVDTNILLDILIPGQPAAASSKNLLDYYLSRGRLIICEVVFAELAAGFPVSRELDQFLRDTGIDLVPSSPEALFVAGSRWADYTGKKPEKRMRCGKCGCGLTVSCPQCGAMPSKRLHVLADFIVGAHALVHADVLLSRDLGIYKTYFNDLQVIGSL